MFHFKRGVGDGVKFIKNAKNANDIESNYGELVLSIDKNLGAMPDIVAPYRRLI